MLQERHRGDEAADRGGGGDHVSREALSQAGSVEGVRRHARRNRGTHSKFIQLLVMTS